MAASTGELLESYVISNLSSLFPGYRLSEKEKILPGNNRVDLHLKGSQGDDLFVEIKAPGKTKTRVGALLDCYSAILNLEPQPKNPRFLVIGGRSEEELRKRLEGLGISFRSYAELEIPIQKLLEDEKKRRLRQLTPTEATIVARWERDRSGIVSVESVCREWGYSRNYARILLHRLHKKRWLERVSRGIYTFIPAEYGYEERFPVMQPLLAGSRLVEPYYFSLATANSYYGFTTQIPSTHFIITTKKKPLHVWRNIGFQFVTVSERKLFGFKEVRINGTKVNMAEPEKAIVDSLDKMRYVGDVEETVRIIYHAFGKIRKEKLVTYAIKMSSHALCQRLGFVLSFLEFNKLIEFPLESKRKLLEFVGKTPVYLSPSRPRKGRFSREWRIVKNLTDRELLSELTIA